MIEQRIIASCLNDRENFEKLSKFIGEDDLEDYSFIIFSEVTEYYAVDTAAQSVDIELLKEKLGRKYPKKLAAFTAYLDQLPDNVSGLNVIKELNDLRRDKLGDEIASALVQKKPAETLMEKFLTETDYVHPITGDVYEAPSLESLAYSVKRENLIPIYPTKLNDAIGGGVPRQSQICIFARPDVGKTTAAINIVGGILQAGYRVLYIGNEDPSEIIILRVLGRLCNVSRNELLSKKKHYDELARSRGYNNFTFAGLCPGTIGEIRSLIEAYEPDVVVVDQVKNLHVTKASSVENLEEAVEHTRNFAKEFNIVSIVVTQAGESARGKLVLDLEDVYNSKTGIPGQMDLMIGIGQDEAHKMSSRVVLSTPKNKLSAPLQPIVCKVDYVCNTIMGPR